MESKESKTWYYRIVKKEYSGFTEYYVQGKRKGLMGLFYSWGNVRNLDYPNGGRYEHHQISDAQRTMASWILKDDREYKKKRARFTVV